MRAGGSLTYGQLDPAIISEAVVADGGLRVRRGLGAFASWPVNQTQQRPPTSGDRITFIDNLTNRPALPNWMRRDSTLSSGRH